MLISYSHKFLFVHLYKTAGNSITSALEPYAYRPGSWRPSNWPTWLTTPRRLLIHQKPPKHASAAELQEILPAEVFQKFFKFAFVRNPWDWQLSLYHYILGQPGDKMFPHVKSLGSFDAYIRWRETTYRTQSSMICDNAGKPLVDFVGRVENVRDDFSEICRRIGVKVDLEHRNKSDHAPYRDCYTEETRSIVARIYTEDIERFGYSF
ncbi:MAG: sulfotransferase family 2 domain-containing protein [Terrimicrobiaceae bacterium]